MKHVRQLTFFTIDYILKPKGPKWLTSQQVCSVWNEKTTTTHTF